eukprot:CAMPEP_0204203476 /NCGR_PEP_ID=MMETSP0361-20130328/68961_1 /ASSEMBLY_ACC=CAM_ASM_000343 /TAXON_ID=268821 /ORGANISM="Scrippsiella Hangoei, Strain SHTV-5" /LENGTH=51 /DNA_ID=CAMNT_0051166435 /DNA_START=49 /DNA_END=204 /DNA_ORIENTATION=+
MSPHHGMTCGREKTCLPIGVGVAAVQASAPEAPPPSVDTTLEELIKPPRNI